YTIIGLTLPNTPPYNLKTKLSRNEKGYTLANINGRVGDSALSGHLNVFTANGRPRVEANMLSTSLDFDDLVSVLGAPPSVKKGESASPEQRAEAARLAAQGRILPDARLDLDRVRNMDAHLIFEAKKIKDAPLPLRSASLDLTLDHGLMKMNPVVFSLPRGDVNAFVQIDARSSEPQVNLDAKLSKARIEDFFNTKNVIEGSLLGRVKLQGRGVTVRQAAATSKGSITMVMPRGHIREAFAELAGVNVTKGLGLLLSGSQKQADLRCAVGAFDVTNGVARERVIVIDTEDVLITGSGEVDLGQEKLDLKLKGHPKEFRLVRVKAPITIGGRWRTPKFGVDADKAVGQAGIAGVAGLLNPLVAILPFVDPGLADDADCKALLSPNPPKRADNAVRAKG
ncbi:MAG: AsmA family protein, partial [Caulobacterales bacterium]